MAFTRLIPIRFEDVDFARVVYFPRFFGYCHNVFEEFFAAEVGVTYAQMLTQQNVGYPTVHAEADFKSPLRFGDTCRIELTTDAVSSRSIACRYRMFRVADGQLSAEVQLKVVAVDLTAFHSVDLPIDVKLAFERHPSV